MLHFMFQPRSTVSVLRPVHYGRRSTFYENCKVGCGCHTVALRSQVEKTKMAFTINCLSLVHFLDKIGRPSSFEKIAKQCPNVVF